MFHAHNPVQQSINAINDFSRRVVPYLCRHDELELKCEIVTPASYACLAEESSDPRPGWFEIGPQTPSLMHARAEPTVEAQANKVMLKELCLVVAIIVIIIAPNVEVGLHHD